jgi:hypothetical protein
MKTLERAMARNLLDFVHTAHEVAPDLGADAVVCAGGVGAFLKGGREPAGNGRRLGTMALVK